MQERRSGCIAKEKRARKANRSNGSEHVCS